MEIGFNTKFHIIIDLSIDTHAFLVWLGSRLIKSNVIFLITERKTH